MPVEPARMSHHICVRILLDLDVGYFGNFLRILTLFWGSVGAGMVRACGGTVDRIDSRRTRTTSRSRWRGEVVSQLSTGTVLYSEIRLAEFGISKYLMKMQQIRQKVSFPSWLPSSSSTVIYVRCARPMNLVMTKFGV